MGDERILGSSQFVETVFKRANENYERRTLARAKGPDLDTLIDRIAEHFGITPETLKSSSKQRNVSRARALVCYLAVTTLMINCSDISRRLNISPSSVSKSVIRGRSDNLSAELEKRLFDI
jgi:chromosomal replication initiation ATPase DnaA